MGTVDRVISTRFLSGLAAYGSGAAGTNSSIAQVVNAQKDEPALKIALRTGALSYATAVRGLNTAASIVNLAQFHLGELGKMADQMLQIANTAKRAGTGAQARANLDLQFRRLATDFQQYLEDSQIQGKNYLTKNGLAEILSTFGLDPNAAESTKDVFDEFQTPDNDPSLASEYEKGGRPIPIPEDAYTTPTSIPKKSVEYQSIFDENRQIKNRPDAYRLAHDLSALKEQISQNQEALESSMDLIAKNLRLARGAGTAFLTASTTITDFSNANKIVGQLRALIRQNIGGALAQADNLEPLAVSALLLKEID